MPRETDTLELFYDELDTPVGRLALLADGVGRLRAAGWTEGHSAMERRLRLHADGAAPLPLGGRTRDPGGWTSAFRAYFDGELRALDDLPVEAGGTEFQRAVWTALRAIPLGATVSYGELARRIGRPAAVRAVGLANGSNPLAVVVPCHRVIGANGMLIGYAGGVDRKRWLLAHEQNQVPTATRQLMGK